MTRRNHRPSETLARRKTLGTEMQPRSFVHLIRKSQGRKEKKRLGCAWSSVESGQNELYILATTKCIYCSEPGTDILPGWWTEEEVCEWSTYTSTPSVDSGLRCSLMMFKRPISSSLADWFPPRSIPKDLEFPQGSISRPERASLASSRGSMDSSGRGCILN